MRGKQHIAQSEFLEQARDEHQACPRGQRDRCCVHKLAQIQHARGGFDCRRSVLAERALCVGGGAGASSGVERETQFGSRDVANETGVAGI